MADREFTSEVDDELRQEFNRLFAADEQPEDVLDHLAPTFRRARRIHQVKQTAIGLAAAVLLLGGTGLIVRSVVSDEAQITVAGEVEDAVGDGQLDGGENADGLAVTGTTIDSSPAADDAGGDDPSTSTSQPDGSTTNTTAGSTGQSQSTSGPSPTTSNGMGSTSIAADGNVTIYSDCGSIVVQPSDSSVQLIDVEPGAGYRQDVKSSGPEKVEVGFEREGPGHCEVEARMRSGRLDIDIEN
jgi:hypothetical protein